MSGECVVRREARGKPDEHLVVERADLDVLASTELVEHWLTDPPASVEVSVIDGVILVRFGTAGKGEGVVTYRIDGLPPAHPLNFHTGPVEIPTIPMRRIQ